MCVTVAPATQVASADSPILGELLAASFHRPGERARTVAAMRRTHALLISLVLAGAVLLGSFAAIRATRLSTSAAPPRVGTAQIARQNAALDRAEAALRAELRGKPPAVPALAPARRAAPPQTVVYRRAPTIVHVVHRHGGERDDRGGDGRGNDGGLDD
jgi:hypothetical protein